jgi:Ni,Fe-hydrogenase I small subunit
MDLHRKSIQNRGENMITGKSQPTGEELAEHNNFIFGVGVCSSSGARPVPAGKNPAVS